MSEMIERCIDALEIRFKAFVEESSGQSFQETKVTLPNRAIFKSYVMTVLNAAREPTEAMLEAGEANLFEHLPESKEWTLIYMRDAYQDMIDEALK